MKKLILLCALSMVFAGCESSEKPSEPVVPTVPSTTVAPTPTTVVNPQAEHCKQGDKAYSCGNPVWWKMDACKPDSDGDNQGEGTVYFKDIAAIKAQWSASGVGSCVRLHKKDGSSEMLDLTGFGPCITCQEL